MCPGDILTDRWPESLEEQGLFVGDLEDLVQQLHVLSSGRGLDEMRVKLARLFGEGPTWQAIRAFNEAQIGQPIRDGGSRHYPDGRLAIPAGAGIASQSSAKRTPRNTFYGVDAKGAD